MRPSMQRPTRILKWSISPPRLTRLRKLMRTTRPITLMRPLIPKKAEAYEADTVEAKDSVVDEAEARVAKDNAEITEINEAD